MLFNKLEGTIGIVYKIVINVVCLAVIYDKLSLTFGNYNEICGSIFHNVFILFYL